MTPFLAVLQLEAFRKGLVGMTESAYDEAFDAVTDFLGRCNNESYRLIPRENPEENSAGDNQ